MQPSPVPAGLFSFFLNADPSGIVDDLEMDSAPFNIAPPVQVKNMAAVKGRDPQSLAFDFFQNYRGRPSPNAFVQSTTLLAFLFY